MKDAKKEHTVDAGHIANDKKEELPPNPFAGRNTEEVWQELYAKSKPISREEVLRRTHKKDS